ncbi:MAG: efflux RND transporter periplasmic adaptor subunit [Chitinophagaceae bacterium]
MNKLSHPALALFCGLITATAMYSCNSTHGEGEKSKIETPATPAATEVFSVQKGKLSSALKLPGELLAFQQVDLYAKVNSFVKKVNVDIGTEVAAGQLLATMEAPELNAQLAAAESRLKSIEALYIASKANYDRLYETSKTPGTISPNDLDQAMAKRNSDYAQLEAAKAAYREVADTRNYLEIRAPFTGVITARNAHPGAYVGPSGKGSEFPIFTLQEQKKLRLVLSVPEAYISYLGKQTAVNFKVRAFNNQQFTAHINRQSGALDNRLRSQRTELDVINNDKKLLPGMIAEVQLPLNGSDSAFIVPISAVVNSTQGIFVIRVNNNKVEWVNVTKGRDADGKVEVFGDLNAGDQLVKTATEEIRNGSTVQTKIAAVTTDSTATKK